MIGNHHVRFNGTPQGIEPAFLGAVPRGRTRIVADRLTRESTKNGHGEINRTRYVFMWCMSCWGIVFGCESMPYIRTYRDMVKFTGYIIKRLRQYAVRLVSIISILGWEFTRADLSYVGGTGIG